MIENVKQLVEVMARAMCRADGCDPDSLGGTVTTRCGDGDPKIIEDTMSPIWPGWAPKVKAALLAAQAEGAEMMPSEATEEMSHMGGFAPADDWAAHKVMASRYRAMLTKNPLRLPTED